MRAGRFNASLSISLCAAATFWVLGCGADVDEPETEVIAEAGGCVLAQAGGSWMNQTFPEHATTFRLDVDATPSASGIDALVGVANGAATTGRPTRSPTSRRRCASRRAASSTSVAAARACTTSSIRTSRAGGTRSGSSSI